MKSESIIINGVNSAKRLAASLVGGSIWFSVEPLAESRYVFTVNAEDLDRVVTRIRKQNARSKQSSKR